MAENEVDIVIRTRAELEGAKQLEKSLQGQIGQAKALGQNFHELTGTLRRVQGAISQAVPEFGALTRVLSTLSVGGPIALLGLGLAHVIAAAKNAMLAVREFGGAVQEVGREGLAKAQKQLDDYTESVNRLKVATEEAALKSDGLRQALTAQKTAQDQVEDARKGKELAEVDALVAGGGLSKEAGAIRKGEIESKFAKSAAARQLKFLDDNENLSKSQMLGSTFAVLQQREAMEQFAKEKGFATPTGPDDTISVYDRMLKTGKSFEEIRELEKSGVGGFAGGRKARSLSGTDVSRLAQQAADDKRELEITLAQLKEEKDLLDKSGFGPSDFDNGALPFALNPLDLLEPKQRAANIEGLEDRIPMLRSKLAQSQQRATDAAQLKKMQEDVEAAEAAARKEQIGFGNERSAADAQRSGLRGALPERLTSIGLTAAGEVAGSIHQAEQTRLAEALKHGFSTSSATTQASTRLILEAMNLFLRQQNIQNDAIKSMMQQLNRDSGLR